MGWKKDMMSVAESLSAGNKALGSEWKLTDILVGLAYLSEKRKTEFDFEKRKADLLASREASSCPQERLKKFAWASSLADIAYTKDEAAIRKYLLSEHGLTLVHAEVESKFSVPAHYWAYNKADKVVVFGVRGTVTRKDMLTDLDSKAEVHSGRAMHRGMLQSAKALLEKVQQQLADLSDEGFRVVLVGHSLGAGTAALLAILLKETNAIKSLSCYAIAPPPVVELSLAVESKPYIESLVCNDDIVCRMSVANMRGLTEELLQLNWGQMAREDLASTRAGKMADYVGTKCGEVTTRVASMKAYNKATDSTKRAVGQVSDMGKKAAAMLKPKLSSMTAYATGKMSKLSFTGKEKGESGAGDAAASVREYPQYPGEEKAIQPLFPPGDLVVMLRVSEAGYEAFQVSHGWSGLNRFELSDSMIQDHYLTSYFDVLNVVQGQPIPEYELVLSQEMFKKEGGKKELIKMAEWKRRKINLLRLRRTFIVEYPSGKDGGKMRRVNLKDAKVVDDIKSSDRPFAFAIENDVHDMKLDPGSKEGRDEWLGHLRTLL
ncbi:alpha/beta-hydrolase [Chloropicon primus]|uniref:sn-1-specific diacylglycerol lipase n=1 Tax=Chloropicon primus TaxID=1764295 RepID=A0A5B8MMD6_9CHLO|nr:alpha/beta-hydrolase [Chloropicon primus]UPR00643.1 alpha/beta-hydrolase [Chloropicon primus]|eukprot:QDZ21431.1 alpha/beta-hydrolase [Chloropicon primus]